MRNFRSLNVPAVVIGLTVLASCGAHAQTAAKPKAAAVTSASAVFAKVGDIEITHDEFNAAFNAATRSKFYHGKPPDHEIAAMQREVSDQMVLRILYLHEGKRRNLRPDAQAINKQIQTYEQRYAGSEQWKKGREQLLPPLVARLEEEDLLGQVEKTVREDVKVNEKQAKAYYAANQEKFTEPEQLRVSLILLKVDPSSPGATWQKAQDEAAVLAKRVRAGEDFAAVARKHSKDGSAEQGGDLGYLHSGMLPDGAQNAIAKMKVGEISDPQRLLEGFAVLRLQDRKVAKLHTFDYVKARAQELAQREQSDLAWVAFGAGLKTKSTVKIDQSRFLPLAK